MKISETRNQATEVVQQYKANEKAATAHGKQVSGNAAPEEKVSLSDRAKDIQQAKKTIDQLPDVREEKVKELKNAIDTGTYRVEGEKVADKMIGESLLDIFV